MVRVAWSRMEHTKPKSGKDLTIALLLVTLVLLLAVDLCARSEANREKQFSASPRLPLSASDFEYLWYEAENMRGITETSRHEPQLNPSYLEIPAVKAPGWSISGPGVSAEWSQGGESEWNSVAASADATNGTIWQDVEIPRAGEYKVWVRYADWAKKSEGFVVRITQYGLQSREGVSMSMAPKEMFHREFGATDIVDSHNEMSMYWGWSFTWDGAPATLAKGSAHVSIEINGPAQARRQVDCFLITNDLSFVPEGRRKPDFGAMRYLRDWSAKREALAPLIDPSTANDVPLKWSRPKVAGRDFLMPWNIAKEFWQLYDKPAAERSLYPFNAEPIDEFLKSYAGKRDVPIFDSKLIVPVVFIGLHLFVAFLQAYIFMLLAMVYVGGAVSHEH